MKYIHNLLILLSFKDNNLSFVGPFREVLGTSLKLLRSKNNSWKHVIHFPFLLNQKLFVPVGFYILPVYLPLWLLYCSRLNPRAANVLDHGIPLWRIWDLGYLQEGYLLILIPPALLWGFEASSLSAFWVSFPKDLWILEVGLLRRIPDIQRDKILKLQL